MFKQKTTWLARLRTFAYVAAGGFSFGLAAGRLWRRAAAAGLLVPREAKPAPGIQPLDDSRAPRHDRPSGYFSARGEGTMTNTPQTNTDFD